MRIKSEKVSDRFCVSVLLLIGSFASQLFAAEANVNSVCIFDVDNTLTHAENANSTHCPNTQFINNPPPGFPENGGTTDWVLGAINKCKDLGYGLAIATAESGAQSGTGGVPNATQHTFLSSLATEFDKDFFASPAFQTSCKVVTSKNEDGANWCIDKEFPRKEAMIIAIMNFFKIPPDEWQNSIMFDDQLENLTAANALHLKTVQSSPGCAGAYCDKGCGITETGLDAIVELTGQ